jgi:hypothetical protein
VGRDSRKAPPRPQWLRQLRSPDVTTAKLVGTLPPWQEALWSILPKGEGTQPALQQVLRFPAVTTCTFETAQAKATCGMGSPILSTQGTHGLHFFLKTPSEEQSVLFLTPATFARLHGEGPSSYSNVPVHSMDEGFIVLESVGFRAEFSVSRIEYEQDQPADLLRALEAQVVLWHGSKSSTTTA